PIITNTNVTITREAIVIPETGRFDVPIVPVKRPATMTNNKDNKKRYDSSNNCHNNVTRN
ncbi:hypothetical protein BM535_23315, partial [Clostridioides difficile]